MRYCLGRPYSTGVRAATIVAVLLMIPGQMGKTGCKKVLSGVVRGLYQQMSQ